MAVLWGSRRESLSLQDLKEKLEPGSSRIDGVLLAGDTPNWCLIVYSQHPDWLVPLPDMLFNILNINP